MSIKETYSNLLLAVIGAWLQILAIVYPNTEPVMRFLGVLIGDACLILVISSLTANHFIKVAKGIRNAKF